MGGKILYLCETHFFISNATMLQGGFSLLGASLGGITGLSYYLSSKKYIENIAGCIPISVLLIHSFGRLGCFWSECCNGTLGRYSLYPIVITFYFIFFSGGVALYTKKYIITLKSGLYYYAATIFLERFLFDPWRFDSIKTAYFLTDYQYVAIAYLTGAFFVIQYFMPPCNKKKP